MMQNPDAIPELVSSILCAACGKPLITQSADAFVARCMNGHAYSLTDSLLEYTPDEALAGNSEVAVRDRQAQAYLSHSKVPIHAMRFREFIKRTPRSSLENYPVLDLGCGPGPTTGILLADGCKVIAVDFSRKSLSLNRGDNQNCISSTLYVKADLKRIQFAKNITGTLVMSDFLQHLGGRDIQKEFLHSIFQSLRPGGSFYLSFFNINLKNLIRSDISGTWDGGISYTRNRAADVLAMLPDDVVVSQQIPMNLCASAELDRVLARLPFADWASRWMLLTGYRRL